jgi:hypothetical protein
MAAEAQARLQVSLRELIEFFEKSGIEPRSVEKLNDFITKNQSIEFLDLCESFGDCMAFIDHDELCTKLGASYNLLSDGYNIEKKMLNKRLKALKEDKKTEPETLAKVENALADVEQKKATVLVLCLRLKNMALISADQFKKENKTVADAVKFYQSIADQKKAEKEKKAPAAA